MFKTFLMGCLVIGGQMVEASCLTLEADGYVKTQEECIQVADAHYSMLIEGMENKYGLENLLTAKAELRARTFCLTPEEEARFKQSFTSGKSPVKGLDIKNTG